MIYIVPNMKRIPKEILIAELQRIAREQKLDSISKTTLAKYSTIGRKSFKTSFGSWNNAVIAAGLKPNLAVQPSGYKRAKIPLHLRDAVTKRDNHRCCICHASPATDPNIELQFDHIYPVSKGGTTTYDNLWLLCDKCNRAKLNYTPLEIMAMAKWHLMKCAEREEQLKGAKKRPFDPADHFQKMLKLAQKEL